MAGSGLATFSDNGQYLSTKSGHKITTWHIASGKPVQTLYVNKKPTKVNLLENRFLYVVVGKAILKTDLQTQPGNLFSYGDGEELDYTFEEIEEWIRLFGDEYLLPLDDEIKKKYGIK